MKVRPIAAAGGLLLAAVVVAWAGGLFTGHRAPAGPATGPGAVAFPAPDLPEAAGPRPEGLRQATFGCGCFWCAEAIFQQLKGVKSVVSGYSGGHVPNPSYEEVCTGTTGHAESVQITYDPHEITYADLLEVFWRTHDPTTLNRQGPDVGPQYRSAIFYHDAGQKELAEHYRAKLDAAHVFDGPIVTEIVPFRAFYPAEDYHQDFFNNHPRQPYCTAIIGPKVEKVREVFRDRLKE
jgi:peptide-methionine (S)-S-oxide reductase